MHDPADHESTVGRWLLLLRDGTEAEQQLARTELGLILEARGLLDEAFEAHLRNVEAGVGDRRPYERLAALAHARGDAATESRALRALADLLVSHQGSGEEPLPNRCAAQISASMSCEARYSRGRAPTSSPARGRVGEGAALRDEPAGEDGETSLIVGTEPSTAREPATEPDLSSNEPVGEPAGVSQDAETFAAVPTEPVPDAADTPTSMSVVVDPAPVAEPPDVSAPPASAPEPETSAPAAEAASEPDAAMLPEEIVPDARPASRTGRVARVLVSLALLLPVVLLLAGALVIQAGGSPEAPRVPTVPVRSTVPPSPSPAAIELRLTTDVQLAPASPALPATPAPSSPPPVTPTPLPEHCADAGLRFPETGDSEESVRVAYRDYLVRQGVAIDPNSTLFRGLGEAYASRHGEILAGWIAVTLQRERRGLSTFSLADYVSSDVIVVTGPGTYQFRATVSPQGWNEIRAWPASSCEGAFIQDPANARWIELMQASVGDITWALPTPSPGR